MMGVLDVVLAVEQGTDEYTEDEILAALSEHRDQLRLLQGFWGRLILQLEQNGTIPPKREQQSVADEGWPHD